MPLCIRELDVDEADRFRMWPSDSHLSYFLIFCLGAALKLGQMLSIQDEGLLPEPLMKVQKSQT